MVPALFAFPSFIFAYPVYPDVDFTEEIHSKSASNHSASISTKIGLALGGGLGLIPRPALQMEISIKSGNQSHHFWSSGIQLEQGWHKEVGYLSSRSRITLFGMWPIFVLDDSWLGREMGPEFGWGVDYFKTTKKLELEEQGKVQEKNITLRAHYPFVQFLLSSYYRVSFGWLKIGWFGCSVPLTKSKAKIQTSDLPDLAIKEETQLMRKNSEGVSFHLLKIQLQTSSF
jgi:hypothetical protein